MSAENWNNENPELADRIWNLSPRLKEINNIINATLFLILVALAVFSYCGDPSYDCHTYAWETRNHENFPPRPAKQVDSGSIVVYFSGDEPIHSGKYLGYGWVKSKFGKNPIMVHPIWLSPYGLSWRFYEIL